MAGFWSIGLLGCFVPLLAIATACVRVLWVALVTPARPSGATEHHRRNLGASGLG